MRRFLAFIATLAVLASGAASAQDAGPDFSTRFAERNPKTLAVLEAEFPSDLKALVIRLGAIGRSGQSSMLMFSGAFDALGSIRRKYANRLQYAPPDALAALLVAAAGFHQSVLTGEGAGGCGVFAQNGTGTLFQLNRSETYAREIDLQSAMYFEAVAEAIERPEYYGELQQSDFAALLAVMAAAGMPKTYAASIASGKPSDPDFCPALIAMFKAAAVFDTPEGLRVRADLARNLAGY
jgi:hypothetical protein